MREITERTGKRVLGIDEAAEYLGISAEAVRALVTQNYLSPLEGGTQEGAEGGEGPVFAASDLKGFMARNTPDEDLFVDAVGADPQALLDALDGRSEEMARRAFDIFKATFTDAREWSLEEQARFVDQARKRFEAILAVTGQGQEVDEALVADLEAVGTSAAWSGSPLPQILVVLRISRDLVVQTAVEIAEEHGRHWGLALSLLLTRILPAIDRLTDALARGYWAAVIGREAELRERMESLVTHASDGVYEIDLDGRVTFANPSFAAIVGRTRDQLEDQPLSEVVMAAPGLVESLMSAPAEPGAADEPGTGDAESHRREIELEIVRPDGVRRLLHVTSFPRRDEGAVVGYQGIVRDITGERELERAKNEFLALVTNDLRSPLMSIMRDGTALQTGADRLNVPRLRAMGRSIHRQAERMSRLADDLHDVSQLANRALSLHLRPVDVAEAVQGAASSVFDLTTLEVEVPPGLEATADIRRLEQVLANLIDNGLHHGDPPVVVRAERAGAEIVIDVTDHGRGVPEAVVPTLFSSLRTVARHDRDREAGTGLGLFLVKGLVEAMGGRVAYEPAPAGGATFRVHLPAASPPPPSS